jgi:hypothetical protein
VERPGEIENKESFLLRHSKCETPDLLQNQTKPNQTRTIAVTVAVAAHQKFINMKTGYSATISLRLRRIKVFAKTN